MERGGPFYAELHCLTHFSFQRGASSPEELVQRAWALGYTALAVTDEASVAGVVRAWQALGALERSQADPADDELAALHAARAAAGVAAPLRLLYGSEFRFEDQGTLVALARDLSGWGDVCSFISRCRGAAEKGRYRLPPLAVALAALPGCERLWAPCRGWLQHPETMDFIAGCGRQERAAGLFGMESGDALAPSAARPTALLVELNGDADDALWLLALRRLAAATGLPLVAAGDVHLHVRARKRLHDVLTAIRLGRPVQQCGFALQPNAERHLRPRAALAQVYEPDLLAATLAVAARCSFRLEEVRYNYPLETVPSGLTPTQALRRLTLQGALERYPRSRYPRVPIQIWRYVAKELRLIAECRYEMFFLTVHDIVREARRLGILCQGRGSAANSVVCWCLGITAADPEKSHPLLERFISRARQNEPPDIDVDFEHERREEVIQYIYKKYGRHRAALAATVIAYRTRSALRDVGQALGVDERLVDAFAKDHHWFDTEPPPGRPKAASAPSGGSATDEVVERGGRHHGLAAERLGELAAKVGAAAPPALMRLWLELTDQLRGAPRHLSQHVGGFVLTETPLHRLVAVEPAAMDGAEAWGVGAEEQGAEAKAWADQAALAPWLPRRPALRQVIQWDKDDLEALGMLKVDVLALGMLTAVRRCIDLVGQRRGQPFTRYDITQDDPDTYAMIRLADTVGTFQIESRAQMSMLPRLKPEVFYDLVVQVAIVRPGPISGGMVHPYLKARERRRQGKPIEYELSKYDQPGTQPRLAKALARTLGIPIFQEQVMELSMLAAGFSAEDADRLRRAMAAWKRKGGLGPFEIQLTEGMLANGYSAEFAARIFKQIQGFGEYGFPESHAYSFALIAYESAWLKCHEPEAFLAAMLNSQPMGFYGPSQLIQDARRHGVQVLPPDVAVSGWDCALELESGSEESGSDRDFLEPNRPPDQAQQAQAAINTIADGVVEDVSPVSGPAAEASHELCGSNRSPAQAQTPQEAIKKRVDGAAAKAAPRPAVRLGLRLVKGLDKPAAQRIAQARAQAPLTSVADLARRAGLETRQLNQLAAADALRSLAGHRRQQVWQGSSLKPAPALLHDAPIDEAPLALPAAPEGEEIVHDYAALGLTLRRHPMALLRERLARRGVQTAAQLGQRPHGARVRAAGLVTVRQQPQTARGTIFVTLEDETGPVNVIVWKSLREDDAQRNVLLRARLMAVEGEWQRDVDSGGQVQHLIARRLHDLTPLLGRLAEATTSRDFH
ncbi:PHP domain-containing protein [Ottowia sp.]|uniref:helix-hairpin-helix domain-containing protein n=1 Tax=Ottowia sp. TaxID=1898956 RepID=UPI0026213568|nr:PHP domain-containing protein [Ottowia sp.]